MEYRIVRPDGHTRWVHDRGAKIYDASGKLYRASGIVRDITAQKQAQQDLRDSEARYRLLGRSFDRPDQPAWAGRTSGCIFRRPLAQFSAIRPRSLSVSIRSSSFTATTEAGAS